MQFSTLIAAVAVVASAVAAPVAEADRNMMAANSRWTMQKFTRTCNAANTSCKYSFAVNANNGAAATPCAYTINGNNASRATYNNIKCGAYTIGSTWSGQFGAGKGFQTLSVVKSGQIIYPGYTDAQLVNGKTVSPDQSYTPQALP